MCRLDYTKHLIDQGSTVREALIRLDALAADAILFIIDQEKHFLGSLTDGDLRRGFIKGLNLEASLLTFANKQPKCIEQGNYDLHTIISLRKNDFTVLPVINRDNQIINVVNFKYQKSYLPVDALIMAGGRGERLRPLTDTIPKPLLPVGGKPILEYNIDRLRDFGIDDLWISLRYLGEQIENCFKDGAAKSIRIKYIYENSPLGTVGAARLVDAWKHDTLLLMNSDLLTNLDFEEFYLHFLKEDADLSVVTIPYEVKVPYAIFELMQNNILSLKEKPTYTYFSNAGIYLMKREVLSLIPESIRFDATDLVESLIQEGRKVTSFPFLGYWLDIGRMEDYEKAKRNLHLVHFR